MALRLTQMLYDYTMGIRMGKQAAEVARARFDLRRQVDAYLNWYQEIVNHAGQEVGFIRTAQDRMRQ